MGWTAPPCAPRTAQPSSPSYPRPQVRPDSKGQDRGGDEGDEGDGVGRSSRLDARLRGLRLPEGRRRMLCSTGISSRCSVACAGLEIIRVPRA